MVPPDDCFPPERVLAPQLGISRVTLREALRALEQAGYIESRRGRNGGAYVTRRRGSTSSPKRKLKAMGDTLADALQFRRALEAAAASLAADRAAVLDTSLLEASLRHSDHQHLALVPAVQRGRPARARTVMESHVEATANLIRRFLG